MEDLHAQVAGFRHSVADIGRFFSAQICLAEGNTLIFMDFRGQMKFGTVVALAVYPQAL